MFGHTDVVILWATQVKSRGIGEACSNAKQAARADVREKRVQRAKRLNQMFENVKESNAIELLAFQGRSVSANDFDLVRSGCFARCYRWLDPMPEELLWKLPQKPAGVAAEVQHLSALGESPVNGGDCARKV